MVKRKEDILYLLGCIFSRYCFYALYYGKDRLMSAIVGMQLHFYRTKERQSCGIILKK